VATPYGTVKRVGDRPKEHAEIAELIAETGAVLLVVGLPISLDGQNGPAARSVLSEVRALAKALPVPVETHDERMSTVTAHSRLAESGRSSRKRRDVVDQSAAAVILQDWIDANRY
jgi:putative Holliday junction resolvase